MGKVLTLGPKLKYPVVITRLLKKPGDDIKKRDAILQYSYKWMKTVGDAVAGDEWEEEQTTIADWESPSEGRLNFWKVKEGMTIARNIEFVDIEEDCPHSVQFNGLCGMCGKDMTEITYVSASMDADRARITMIHDQTNLTVSQDEASRAEEETHRRLLQQRKLSLVVDLDQTIIHACIEPTVGEWQDDPTSPNYDAVKDVKKFQLDDGGGNRNLFNSVWYYIKMRPGLKEFLNKISELYELHVYTMGTRAYAVNIAKLVDPDQKLFGERIISRDENNNMTAKNLARLFPVNTKMVVIIDDRADVWPENRMNLIKVHPYDFFLGIGDINSSFLPKREEIPKVVEDKIPATVAEAPQVAAQEDAKVEISDDAKPTVVAEAPQTEGASKISALEAFVKMGGGGDQALLEEQSAEQERFLEKQLTERPLAHLQEKLDKDVEEEEATATALEEKENGQLTPPKPHPHQRHNLLKDDDVELMYLEKHLSRVHKAFYEQYDNALVNASGGRVAQLKPGHNKKIHIRGSDAADLQIVPDIGYVMPFIKSQVLEGTVLVLSGLVPLSTDVMKTEIAIQARSFGAQLELRVSRKVTHLITPSSRTRTTKVREAARYPNIKIVTHQWLLETFSKWERQDETPFLVETHESDRSKVAPESDDSDGGLGSEDEGDETDFPASQDEEIDADGVMPDEESSASPVDENADWSAIHDEFAEFMGNELTGDSDSDSDGSLSSKSSEKSSRGKKRTHLAAALDEAEEENESDTGSKTSKRLRVSNTRSTGLKSTTKSTENVESESSLPTPGQTDADGEVEADTTDDDDFADLEADLEAEFEAEGSS